MSFRRYFAVRLGWALLGLWIAATVVFAVFYVAAEDPARQACGGERATPNCLELVRQRLDLDAPLPEQYVRFLWRLLADQSPAPRLATEGESGQLARDALPATLSVVVPALIVAVGVAGACGIALSRTRRRRIFELPIYVAFGLTPVALGIWLSYYVGVRWGVTPIANYCDFFNPPRDQTDCGGALDWATHLILPVVTLSLYFAAVYTRIVRALAREARSEDDPDERRKRGRRSALLFTRAVGRDFGFAIGLAVIIEATFQIPGLGRLALTGAYAQADDLVQAAVLYATFVAIAVHFLVDVVVGALDPSLRWEKPVARRPKAA